MSDASIARIARQLAVAFATEAYERDDEARKLVAALKAELCAACRLEFEEAQKNQPKT